VNLADAVAARRSIRAFEDKPVARSIVERAVSLAVQAPAPHHSSPWRFVIVESPEAKESFSRSMGERWRQDLSNDGYDQERVESIVGRSHQMLTTTPVLVICCADMSRSHSYSDERRRLAEWSLFAHSVGASLQTFMTALAEDGVGSCWISAPVFCREDVRSALDLDPQLEPQALVLVGYPHPGYQPRPRPEPDPADYILDRG
jgi:coenzyme F420-0:L-glutamate ligase/coenzyme F420-1:gamma-L-glutamate ligase